MRKDKLQKDRPPQESCEFEGYDVYNWPEFKAFALRLGIDWGRRTTDLTITIPIKGVVRVAHDYQADDRHLPLEEE